MKKIISILLALAILAALAACGYQAKLEAENGVPQPVAIHGMLTRIEYGGNTAYLFGTMHAGQPDWFPLHPIAEQALARTDVVVLEIDLDEITNMSAEFMAEMAQWQTLPFGQTLEDVLPAHIFEPFRANFESYRKLGLTYERVRHLTPAALLLTLQTLLLQLGEDAVDFELSVDSYIADFAHENGLPIIGLETAADQMRHLFDIPLDIQAYALVDFPSLSTLMQAEEVVGLAQAYASQEVAAILAVLEADLANTADNPYQQHFHHVHFHLRCHLYADEIARLLRETEEPTTFFVAIGIAHLIGGSFGQVPAILEGKGFTLTPLWD